MSNAANECKEVADAPCPRCDGFGEYPDEEGQPVRCSCIVDVSILPVDRNETL